jgi:adenylate cyclase
VSIRIGIASGPVVAGIVGSKKFFHDVWGRRRECRVAHGIDGCAGQDPDAPETFERVKDQSEFERRGVA